MTIFKNLFIAACLMVTSQAFAQNVEVDNNVQRSEAETEGADDVGQVGITNFAVRPSAGAVFFNGQEEFAGGVLIDFNLANLGWMKIGPAIGALYSPIDGGDFFSGITTNNNSYIFQIPGNVKLTFAPDPSNRLHLGVHGGANIIRSSGTVGTFGGATTPTTNLGTTASGASWDARPNVGGDIDFALGTNADLTLRPDVTFLPNFNMVTTTLGLALKL